MTQHHIEELLEQRHQLEAAQMKLQHAQQTGRLLSPYKVLGAIESKHKYEDKHQQLVEDVQRMKFLGKDETEVSQSCTSKNLGINILVRGLLDEIIESAVIKAQDGVCLKNTKSQAERLLLLDSSDIVSDYQPYQQMLINAEKIIQLVAEEIMLEITNQLTVDIADEWLHVEQFASFQAQQLVLQTVEHATTRETDGRNTADPAYSLISATYHTLCQKRQQHSQGIWSHSQCLVSKLDGSVEKLNLSISLQPDVHILDLLHLTSSELSSTNEPPPDNRDQERQYWRSMTQSKCNVKLSKNIQGISSSAASPCQKYAAFGTIRGDVVVYNLSHHPPIPAYYYCNRKAPDAIYHIAWSQDDCRLATITQNGNLQIWSTQSDFASTKDIKELQIKPSRRHIPLPSQLIPLVALCAKNNEFNFNTGPLSDIGLHFETQFPIVSAFYPTHASPDEPQSHLIVGLSNGDILRCNLEDDGIQKTLQDEATVNDGSINDPKVKTRKSFIGNDDISAELFRSHQSSVRHIGFVSNHGDMVSVDVKGRIFIWKYCRKQYTYFGWYEPQDKSILEMAERVFIPLENEEPLFHVGSKLDCSPFTKQEPEDLENAERFLQRCKLEELWHKTFNKEHNTVTQIYKPIIVEETGGLFHTVVREQRNDDQLGDLLQHSSIYCKPAKNFHSRWFGVQQTHSGEELIFMLLFPDFWPKGPHMTFIIVNIESLQVRKTNISVNLTAAEYNLCLENDVCSFQISPSLDATNSEYIFCYILGILRVFSVTTGTLVTHVWIEDWKPRSGIKKTMINVAGNGRQFLVMFYSKTSNCIEFVELKDQTCS
ncbi:uncharacterized protein [Amphiura filiformis]|uniref:uncharacterized protein n=1 Tax=Amphiura filiformis TaxID=82378 RepID=UPI003B213D7B